MPRRKFKFFSPTTEDYDRVNNVCDGLAEIKTQNGPDGHKQRVLSVESIANESIVAEWRKSQALQA